MKTARSVAGAALTIVMTSIPALAHPGHSVPNGSLTSGLIHPLLGMDHLLAMLMIGLLAAQIGGRAVWIVPGSFLASMVLGGLTGIARWSIPAVEFGIAASVILLGLAVALNLKLALVGPVVFAGFSGFFHGYAHGTEMPRVASPALYACGFVLATLLLHIAGVWIGKYALRSAQGESGLRISGGVAAAVGLLYAIRI